MGNLDRWSTPKQIKIERAGDPRPLRRGPLKKGERRKGVKARRDEVISAYKNWQLYKGWYEDSLKRNQASGLFGTEWTKKNAETAFLKYTKIKVRFLKDYNQETI